MVLENRNVATNETSTQDTLLIDNSHTIYIPMRLRCGITVMCHQDIFEPPHEKWLDRIRMILQTDVSYCLHVLPVSARSLIRRTKIWLNGQTIATTHLKQYNNQSMPITPQHIIMSPGCNGTCSLLYDGYRRTP